MKKDVNFQNIVEAINNKYVTLFEIDNDELRSRLKTIQNIIIKSDNDKTILNNYLIDVYAIIKETERRFAKGNIVVTANEQDKKLASSYNFVTIDGDKAIYKNQWIVRGSDYTWDMVPYDEQILGGVYLHYGYATEMATGEGKTLVAIFPVFLNALTHLGVHIITSNEYLSCRDSEQTCPIYMFHGLTVGQIKEEDKTYNKYAYEQDITFGSISTFIFDYLHDQLTLRKEDIRVLRPYNIAVVDELDSILIDDAQIPHIISSGCYYDNSEYYKKYNSFVQELLQNKDLYLCDSQHISFTNEGKDWLKEKLNNSDLFKFSKTYEITDFENLAEEKKLYFKTLIEIQNVLSNLLFAYLRFEKDKDYVVENDKVVIIDQNTGRLRPSSRWEHGLHTAIEVKENVTVEKDYDGTAVISVKNFFRFYKSICGMSGTITQVEKELKEVYNISSIVIPTHRPIIRTDNKFRVFKNIEDKDASIVSLIKQIHNEGRPILVGCLTEKRNEDICSLLDKEQIPFNKLSAKTLDRENNIISQAGRYGAITISTSIAGRGTDIKLTKESKDAGGLFVIGTEMFNSQRIDRQLKGRAGRQGDPGDSQFFVSIDDDIIKCLPDYEKISSDISLNKDIEITSNETIALCERAQKAKEESLYKSRFNNQKKDDVVDKFRNKFYKERMSFLLGKNRETSEIKEIKIQASYEEKVFNNLHVLYEQIKSLAIKIIRNERVEHDFNISTNVLFGGNNTPIAFYVTQTNDNHVDIDIPFSVNNNLFVLTFNRNKIVDSEYYFTEEFKRQIMLITYDKYWTKFVKHILSDLDDKEIDKLPEDYEHLYENINKEIINRLIDSIIPINIDNKTEETYKTEDCPEDHVLHEPLSEELCPCGSGKKYCECHGRHSIRKNKRRR